MFFSLLHSVVFFHFPLTGVFFVLIMFVLEAGSSSHMMASPILEKTSGECWMSEWLMSKMMNIQNKQIVLNSDVISGFVEWCHSDSGCIGSSVKLHANVQVQVPQGTVKSLTGPLLKIWILWLFFWPCQPNVVLLVISMLVSLSHKHVQIHTSILRE